MFEKPTWNRCREVNPPPGGHLHAQGGGPPPIVTKNKNKPSTHTHTHTQPTGDKTATLAFPRASCIFRLTVGMREGSCPNRWICIFFLKKAVELLPPAQVHCGKRHDKPKERYRYRHGYAQPGGRGSSKFRVAACAFVLCAYMVTPPKKKFIGVPLTPSPAQG